MEYLNDVEISLFEKEDAIIGLENVPDGMMTISQSNKEHLTYRLQINDMGFF